jgi:hypothetical protein
MEKNANVMEPLIEQMEEFGKTHYVLFKLKAAEKVSATGASLIAKGSVLLIVFSCLLLATIGLSLWLGDMLGKVYYGFFCTAAVYALFALILVANKEKLLKARFQNAIISQLLN